MQVISLPLDVLVKGLGLGDLYLGFSFLQQVASVVQVSRDFVLPMN